MPAIALYKRILHDFPQYRELAGIYYYLGHALGDSSRIPEAQQVWRSLVCHNHYTYPVAPDPKDPSRDTLGKLVQDHDGDYWTGWRNRHPKPIGEERGKKGTTAAAVKKGLKGKAKVVQRRRQRRAPLQEPIPRRLPADSSEDGHRRAEPRYIAEVLG